MPLELVESITKPDAAEFLLDTLDVEPEGFHGSDVGRGIAGGERVAVRGGSARHFRGLDALCRTASAEQGRGAQRALSSLQLRLSGAKCGCRGAEPL